MPLVAGATIAEVKRAFARQLLLGARKAIILRWHGAELDDDATLDQMHIAHGATLQAAFRARTAAELEELRTIRHILMVDVGGNSSSIDSADASTRISSLKALLKSPEAQLYFSPAFTSAFGTPLAACFTFTMPPATFFTFTAAPTVFFFSATPLAVPPGFICVGAAGH